MANTVSTNMAPSQPNNTPFLDDQPASISTSTITTNTGIQTVDNEAAILLDRVVIDTDVQTLDGQAAIDAAATNPYANTQISAEQAAISESATSTTVEVGTRTTDVQAADVSSDGTISDSGSLDYTGNTVAEPLTDIEAAKILIALRFQALPPCIPMPYDRVREPRDGYDDLPTCLICGQDWCENYARFQYELQRYEEILARRNRSILENEADAEDVEAGDGEADTENVEAGDGEASQFKGRWTEGPSTEVDPEYSSDPDYDSIQARGLPKFDEETSAPKTPLQNRKPATKSSKETSSMTKSAPKKTKASRQSAIASSKETPLANQSAPKKTRAPGKSATKNSTDTSFDEMHGIVTSPSSATPPNTSSAATVKQVTKIVIKNGNKSTSIEANKGNKLALDETPGTAMDRSSSSSSNNSVTKSPMMKLNMPKTPASDGMCDTTTPVTTPYATTSSADGSLTSEITRASLEGVEKPTSRKKLPSSASKKASPEAIEPTGEKLSLRGGDGGNDDEDDNSRPRKRARATGPASQETPKSTKRRQLSANETREPLASTPVKAPTKASAPVSRRLRPSPAVASSSRTSIPQGPASSSPSDPLFGTPTGSELPFYSGLSIAHLEAAVKQGEENLQRVMGERHWDHDQIRLEAVVDKALGELEEENKDAAKAEGRYNPGRNYRPKALPDSHPAMVNLQKYRRAMNRSNVKMRGGEVEAPETFEKETREQAKLRSDLGPAWH